MSRTLYNEGRVVGLSAYEIFVRHVLGADPTATVPSEQEWLASMLSKGSSMLLQIGADAIDGSHYIEVELPATSTLWTANTIVGSFFLGEGVAASAATGWCTRVSDYGPLIQKDSSASPSADGTTIPPTSTSVDISSTTRAQLIEYTKIIDGIVIQPGAWSANTTTPPQKSLTPDVSGTPKLRILLSDKIDTPFYVLFTGFTYKGILNNVMDYNTFNNHPENGDFLGPVSFPWANKIIFSVPSAVLADFQAVSVEVMDLAGMYLYNTKYLWMYRNPSDHDLTVTDLENVRTFNGVQVISGYVSQEFIDTYCVDYDTAMAAGAEGRIGDDDEIQIDYINQIVDIYTEAVARTKFKYCFQKATNTLSQPSDQGHFWPVEIDTGKIVLTLSSAEGGAPTLRVGTSIQGFNFSGASITIDDVTIPSASTRLLGSYWNRPANADQETCDYEPAFVNHPMQKVAIKDYNIFGKPRAGVPLPPDNYGYDFTTWLSATPIKQALAGDDTVGENILNGVGIHADYQELDAMSFFQYAMTERDMSLPITTDYSADIVSKDFYLFKKSDIEAIAAQSAWSQTYTATERFKASFSKADYFKPAKMVGLDSNNTDITKRLTDSGYHLWGTETKVNRDSAIALSLTDGFGGLLPMGGTQGTLTGDMLNWDMISGSLNQNRSIDLLGPGLRGMKGSGTNFVKLGNGLRLYVSATEPTDTDVPEGSIGLGWNGVQIYTSGAWTSAIS